MRHPSIYNIIPEGWAKNYNAIVVKVPIGEKCKWSYNCKGRDVIIRVLCEFDTGNAYIIEDKHTKYDMFFYNCFYYVLTCIQEFGFDLHEKYIKKDFKLLLELYV